MNDDIDNVIDDSSVSAESQPVYAVRPSASSRAAVLDDIVRTGHVTRGWIGVEPSDITVELAAALGVAENTGAVITDILSESPAEQAGLQRGDVITRVNQNTVRNVQDK